MKIISNQKNRKILKFIIFFFPISFIIAYVFFQIYFGYYIHFFELLTLSSDQLVDPMHIQVLLIGPSWYEYWMGEDNAVENVTAIAFIISAIVGFVITWIFIKKENKKFAILYMFLAISFLIVGMEEISWAQRIFNLETPEIFSSNLQNQITIHNLMPVKTYLHDGLMVVGFLGAFSWVIFKKLENSKLNYVRIFVPPWFLMFYFFPIFIFYLMGIIMPFDHQRFELGDWIPMNDQEPPELFLAFGILLFTIVSFVRQNSGINE